MATITYTPIGTIHTPWQEMTGMPVQPVAAQGIPGTVVIAPDFVPGLRDLNGFSHLILLYHLHQMTGYQLTVTPFLDTVAHGIFATRSPKRPNPIGFSVVRLLDVMGDTLRVADVDMLDGTPLLDLKPYVPAFDAHDTERIGWFAANIEKVHQTRADERFR